MPRPASLRRAVAAALLLCTAAGAQQISLSQTPDRRLAADPSKQATYRSASKFPDWINFADCASNVLLHFQLAVSNIPTNGSLQVWAGTDDCSKLESRTGETTRTCWPVSPVLPSQQNVSVDVQSQHVVAFLSKTASEKPKTWDDVSAGVTSSSRCTSSSNGATAVKLWFMFTDGSSNVLGTPLQWATSVDVNGPAAPTSVTPSAGDAAINLSWSVSDAVSDVAEYVLYCLPQSAVDAGVRADAGSTTGTDAGAGVDGGVDAATLDDAGSSSTDGGADADVADAASSGAGSSLLDAGSSTCKAPWSPEPTAPLSAEFLSTIANYECGRSGGASRSSRVSGFAYGVPVALAIAAVDVVDNMGGIKAGGCATPVRTITFWDRYEDAGGDAGGCSFGAPALPGSSVVLGAFVGLAALLRLRRKGS